MARRFQSPMARMLTFDYPPKKAPATFREPTRRLCRSTGKLRLDAWLGGILGRHDCGLLNGDLKRTRAAADEEEPAKGRGTAISPWRTTACRPSQQSTVCFVNIRPFRPFRRLSFNPVAPSPTVNRIAMRSQPPGANLSVLCRPIFALISPLLRRRRLFATLGGRCCHTPHACMSICVAVRKNVGRRVTVIDRRKGAPSDQPFYGMATMTAGVRAERPMIEMRRGGSGRSVEAADLSHR
uniref:Uncharacterized protein n=1 Tax=Plectus sambesii TaxID=2011161 RepID=A0A914WZZ4_9BILA